MRFWPRESCEELIALKKFVGGTSARFYLSYSYTYCHVHVSIPASKCQSHCLFPDFLAFIIAAGSDFGQYEYTLLTQIATDVQSETRLRKMFKKRGLTHGTGFGMISDSAGFNEEASVMPYPPRIPAKSSIYPTDHFGSELVGTAVRQSL